MTTETSGVDTNRLGGSAATEGASKSRVVDEETPLVSGSIGQGDATAASSISSAGFFWIEAAIFSNVFLAGFDGTVTATTYATIGSEFHASNIASWITTSYLLSSTAIQPLYGRFSDIFGRRACFLVASVTFAVGCLGCGFSRDIITLNFMRALTGVGGGGLTTMSTIINSDIVSSKQRGMYQAFQNGLLGFGAICGASLGGTISDFVGWRYCFLLQLPVSALAIVCGWLVIDDSRLSSMSQVLRTSEKTSSWKQVDIPGSILLVLGLTAQLAALTMGGNDYDWTDAPVTGLFAASVLLMAVFVIVECKTKAIPIIPMKMFHGVSPVSLTISNVCIGLSAYGFLFTMPLFFQAILLDKSSKAGLRMIVPSMTAPVGGLVAGIVMSRNGSMRKMIWFGLALTVLGNGLLLSLKRNNPAWVYVVYLLPAGFGQGMAYPSLLFSFIKMMDPREHAVATSVVYLTRSVGSVWGVAITSTIIQSSAARLLPEALRDVPGYEQIIEDLRHSIYTLRTLEPEVRSIAQDVYYQSIEHAFQFTAILAIIGFLTSFLIKTKRMDS